MCSRSFSDKVLMPLSVTAKQTCMCEFIGKVRAFDSPVEIMGGGSYSEPGKGKSPAGAALNGQNMLLAQHIP